MNFNDFLDNWITDYHRKQEYKRIFDEMMKVKDNPIQDFLEGKNGINNRNSI